MKLTLNEEQLINLLEKILPILKGSYLYTEVEQLLKKIKGEE